MVAGRPAALGGRAFDLLLALIEHRDRVVPKTELFDRVWPGLVVEENNLQVQISALRKLLGPAVIVTIPGRGYRFALAPEDAPIRPRRLYRPPPRYQRNVRCSPACPPSCHYFTAAPTT